MLFFPGLHMVNHARHFPRCMISTARLIRRKSDFVANEWMLDSGAFTALMACGRHPLSPREYAALIRRWSRCGRLVAAASQDWLCTPEVLARTGLTVEEHQRRSLRAYQELLEQDTGGVYIMPVLQGMTPEDYLRHLDMYGDLLAPDMWVGVGSVCKRNTRPTEVAMILNAIRRERPDLRLHGFGLKTTSLALEAVRSRLYSSDSMAWSFQARRAGRDPNDWREAWRFMRRIERTAPQIDLFL